MQASILFSASFKTLAFVLFLFQGGCKTHLSTDSKKTIPLLQQLVINDVLFEAEVVCKATQMQQGLMYRTTLPANQGMLFVYKLPQQVSFWMHNTHVALDIGYFSSDGVLQEVYPLYPYNTDPVTSHRSDIQYALEMNQGWFAKNKIFCGAILNIEALK